jgi:hypothetical protein
MKVKEKLIAVASLAAPLLIGGAAGVAVAELPITAVPAHSATAAAHTARPSAPGTVNPGPATAPPGDLAPGEHQAEADPPGGHQDPPGVSVDYQSSGAE